MIKLVEIELRDKDNLFKRFLTPREVKNVLVYERTDARVALQFVEGAETTDQMFLRMQEFSNEWVLVEAPEHMSLHAPRNQPSAKPGTILWCGLCRAMNVVGPDGEVIHKPVDAGQHSEA
jgi:hypothetical protein